MKSKLIINLVLTFGFSTPIYSQSLYHLQFNFQNLGDSTTYHAFLVRFEDGSGLLRVRYLPEPDKDVLIEMDIEEQTVPDKLGMPDTNILVLKAINPRFIVGNDKIKFSAPVFIFKINPVSGYFDPAAVVASGHDIMTSPNSFLVAELIDRVAIRKDFVLQFFSADEDFYVNLFTDKTRGLTPVEKSTKLHLLIVADTLDKEIGSACAKDMRRIVETFTGLTNFLGINISIKTICGKEYSKPNIQTAVNNLKPSANDIVIFYYTGHGFRIPERPVRFPNLKLKNFKNLRESFRDSITWINKDRRDNITYSMNIEDIFTAVKKKGARFNLVMSDCCNNDIFGTNAVGTKPGKTKGSGIEWSEDNLRTLFLNKTPTSILLTAASNGQKATSNNDFGGFCSYFFKTSMENYCSKLKTNVTWDLILQDTKRQTAFKARHTYCDKPYIPQNICQQDPDYKIVFGR